jgi:tRNA-splicing ligase RtcB
VGFDISCGVGLLVSSLQHGQVQPRLPALMNELDRRIPRGAGPGGVWRLYGPGELEQVLCGGSRYAVERGHGMPGDLAHCEDRGAVDDADPDQVSVRAQQRGPGQVGSLGSGNHFLELQVVEVIYDQAAAEGFGLYPGQVCVMIHCGSRGLGHQVCTDHVRAMLTAMPRYGITVPDPQLACARCDRRKAEPTWARWPLQQIMAEPTGNCSPKPPAGPSR